MGLRFRRLLVAGFLLVPQGEVAAAPLIGTCVARSAAAEGDEAPDCPGTPDWIAVFVAGDLGPILANNNHPNGPPTDFSASLVEFSAGSPPEIAVRSSREPEAAVLDQTGSESRGGADFLIPLSPDSETVSDGGGPGAEIFDAAKELAGRGLAALATLCIGALGVTVGVRRRRIVNRELRTASARR